MRDSGDLQADITGLPAVHRAYLCAGEDDGIRCGLCSRRCLVREEERGFCEARVNVGGELYTLAYGDIIRCESRPVEIKPFYHYHPGKTLLTICGPSCNLRCPWCQNHSISRAVPRPLKARHVTMMEVVRAAEAAGDVGLCASFTEPTMIFEYLLGLFREAGARKMGCALVSNGYMTAEALHMLVRSGMDAINVDIKGSAEVYRDFCEAPQGDLPAWETVRGALEWGVHVEVTYLAVTGVNDSIDSFGEVCAKHLEYAGPGVPLHVTGYSPAFEFSAAPTPAGFLDAARRTALDAGILFPYLGNVPGHPGQNTFCPECGALLIERSGFALVLDHTESGTCPACGYRLPVVN
jgi:pyruvate formate lyase activating enzyme